MSSPQPVAPAPTNPVHTLATMLLARAAVLLEQAGYTVPARVFVSDGPTVVPPTCEQLTVSLQRLYTGTPAAESRAPQACLQQTTGVFALELHRCVPTVDEYGAPSPGEQEAAALALSNQGLALLLGFQAYLGASRSGDRLVGLTGPLSALTPAGGLGGWSLPLTVQVRS